MSQAADTRVQRWIDNAMGWNENVLNGSGGSNVFYEGDRLYSYGRHFELGRILRDGKGEPRAIWLNGDTYSVTTSRHQASARVAARRSLLPTVIVPERALSAARISIDSIEPLDARDDRWQTFPHTAETLTGAYLKKDDPVGRTKKAERWVHDSSAHSGYSLKEVDVVCQVDDPNRRYVTQASQTVAERGEDGLWRWETSRHWLGDSLIRARISGSNVRRLFLSSFDYQEARPLYFLCEMPRSSKARTVEDAYEDLKPNAVKDAESAGLEIARQGDMFAIPTELTTREVKKLTPYGKGRIVKRPRFGVLGTRHTASEIVFATGGRIYARGLLYHEPDAWREPDHARRKMGDGRTWHLLTRNTVPRQQARERSVV